MKFRFLSRKLASWAILGADFEFGMDEVVTGTIDLLWLQGFGVNQKRHGRETTNLYIF